jgi:hypothetical protein
MTTTRWLSLVLFAAGCAIAAIGIAVYEAWWTAAFAIGGAVVALSSPRLSSPARSIAVAGAASGAALLAGMSVFFLYGSMWVAGTTWLMAALGSIAAAIVLALLARRLLVDPAGRRDIDRR